MRDSAIIKSHQWWAILCMKVVNKHPHYRVCLHSSNTGGTGDPFPFTEHQSVSKSGDGLYRFIQASIWEHVCLSKQSWVCNLGNLEYEVTRTWSYESVTIWLLRCVSSNRNVPTLIYEHDLHIPYCRYICVHTVLQQYVHLFPLFCSNLITWSNILACYSHIYLY